MAEDDNAPINFPDDEEITEINKNFREELEFENDIDWLIYGPNNADAQQDDDTLE
jgi:hypothetical protein